MPKTIMITGHRPNKLYGYNTHSTDYDAMRAWMQARLEYHQPTTIVSGMALGVDQIFVEEALKYKASHPDVLIRPAIPCAAQDSKWIEQSKQAYQALLKQCDEPIYENKEPYTYQCMQDRNIAMVDASDVVLAVWNGDRSGGTWNCLVYLKSMSKTLYKKDVYTPTKYKFGRRQR